MQTSHLKYKTYKTFDITDGIFLISTSVPELFSSVAHCQDPIFNIFHHQWPKCSTHVYCRVGTESAAGNLSKAEHAKGANQTTSIVNNVRGKEVIKINPCTVPPRSCSLHLAQSRGLYSATHYLQTGGAELPENGSRNNAQA